MAASYDGVQFPTDTQRIVLVGATGTGKTNAAMWHLSRRDFNLMPWVIYDFKQDDAINRIEGLRHIEPDDDAPTDPGLYAVHPHPTEDVEPQLWDIWENEYTGVYIDEGLMMGNNNAAFRALLTQGRSKHIPMIICSQRPVWLDRFVYSESDYFQVFRLQHRKDLQAVQEFIPYSIEKRLPEFHSYYYDVARNKMIVMRPTPDPDAVLDTLSLRTEDLPARVF